MWDVWGFVCVCVCVCVCVYTYLIRAPRTHMHGRYIDVFLLYIIIILLPLMCASSSR